MIVYRKRGIPIIYSTLTNIRKKSVGFVDCEGDLDLINRIKKLITNNEDFSKFELDYEFRIAISFPDEVLNLKGKTDKRLYYTVYAHNLWDINFKLHNKKPSESVNIYNEELDDTIINKLYVNESCLKFIELYATGNGKKLNYYINNDDLSEIKRIEKQLFATYKLTKEKMNLSKLNIKNKKYGKKIIKIGARLRKNILTRDRNRCIICGGDSSEVKLHIDHIIPRNIINRLDLDKKLIKSEYNLITTCEKCNSGKSDFLKKGDIEFYLDKFDVENHPNKMLIKYLKIIKKLQLL